MNGTEQKRREWKIEYRTEFNRALEKNIKEYSNIRQQNRKKQDRKNKIQLN